MKQAIIVELLSGSHSFQKKTAETGYSGVDNIDEQWKKVIWSDESRFTLFKSDGKTRVWRLPKKKKYDIDCVVPTVKHGSDGVVILCGNLWSLWSELKE